MTTRREKSKPQKPQLRSAQEDASLAKNKQSEVLQKEKPEEDDWGSCCCLWRSDFI
jgi:hypothetical protein